MRIPFYIVKKVFSNNLSFNIYYILLDIIYYLRCFIAVLNRNWVICKTIQPAYYVFFFCWVIWTIDFRINICFNTYILQTKIEANSNRENFIFLIKKTSIGPRNSQMNHIKVCKHSNKLESNKKESDRLLINDHQFTYFKINMNIQVIFSLLLLNLLKL